MTVELIRAGIDDAQELWQMQKEAFAQLLERYRDYDTSPASEPLERTVQRLSDGSSFSFIVNGGEKVGAIRIVTGGERNRISPVFIMPQHRGKGLAQAAIALAEQLHGGRGWELSTIAQEAGNCHLYEKLGYRRTGQVQAINERMDLVFYEKD